MLYFMRHAKAEGLAKDDKLTEEGIQSMKETKFIENVLRMNLDSIHTSPATRAIQTAEQIAKIMKEYRNKKVKIKIDEKLRSEDGMDTV